MVKRIFQRFTSLMLAAAILLPFFAANPMPAYAATNGTLTGLNNADIGASYIGSDSGGYTNWTVSGGAGIIGTAKAQSGMCGDTQYNTTLTITNNKTMAAILSFDYSVTLNSGTIQVAGNTVTAGGRYSSTLEPGASIQVYLGSGSTSETKIEITNLSLIVDVQTTTTFRPAENGSYTVDGLEVTEETTKTQQSTIAYSLSAAAAEGYKFGGWYSITQEKYLSTDTETALYLDSDQTVTAVFIAEDAPVFDVGGSRFTDLNNANEYARLNGIGKITLVSDGVLSAGDYTISSGVTLLIPFDNAHTVYTTAPETTGGASYIRPSCYQKLTMAEGAHIRVDGAISVGAKHSALGNGFNGEAGGGAPTGTYGYIFMDEGSTITVNRGGGLYVYGYLSGNGTVTAKSGAVVYENMQIRDFRGGSVTLALNGNEQKVFPLNQYFIQNIEAKLILESGADEYVYTSLYASSMSTSTTVHFIGEEGMFTIEGEGYFTKRYLPDQDRLEVEVFGDASINNLTLKVSSVSVSSVNYVLPITNGMSLHVLSGTTTITQDVALLAGVDVSVAQGAVLKINSGSSLYVYDRDEWTKNNYASSSKFKTVNYSPTRTYTRTDADLTDAQLDLNGALQADGFLYTTAGGADIISSEGTGKLILTNGAGTETVTYQVYGTGPTYDALPINSAKLHNSSQYAGTEGEYTLTDGAAAGSIYYFDALDGKWKQETAAEKITITFDANGGEGSMEPQTIIKGKDTTLNKNAFSREGYCFTGWNTAADGSGAAYGEEAILTDLTEDITLYAQWRQDGWFTDEFGTGYIYQGEKLAGQWKTIEGNTYYFKEDGYIAKGVYETTSPEGGEAALYVFDNTTGVFLSETNGLYHSSEEIYWVESGKAIKDAGLVRIVLDSGEVNYYYFGADGKAYKETDQQTDFLVEKNNGLGLPAGINYPFGPDGVIRHFEDTAINGIYYDETSGNYYFCVDGVIIANGLMLINGAYYYARTSNGAFVTGQSYWVTKTNGLLDEGIYTFDNEGKIVFAEEEDKKNGIVEENGSLYYYEDGVLTGAGLIQIDGDYYYVRTSTGEVVYGRSYWVTVTNGLLPAAQYTFDGRGKMIDPPGLGPGEPEVKNGIVEENGSLYYYEDGVLTGAGLIQIDGNYYYVRTSTGEVVHGRSYWVTVTNGLLESKIYVFDNDGKMILE